MRLAIKRCDFILALFLISLLLFSCMPDAGNEITIEEEMEAESRHAIEQFGEVLDAITIDDQSLARSTGIDSKTTNIKANENGIKSTFHLVAYRSINPVWLEHINTIPKQSFHIPALKNNIDLSANYIVVFRSCYPTGKNKKVTAAYREIYLLDKSSVQNNGNVLLQFITCSPDFEYDILNEIEIRTGEPKKYNWISGKVEEADRFIEDNETDFSELFEGDPQIKAWKFVKPDGTPVTETDSVATYILEVDKTYVEQFFGFAIGSLYCEHIRIRNFTYEGEDREHKAYLEISRYPDNYIHTWEASCYWYDEGKWNYIQPVQTDEDLKLIWYKDITQESLATFFNEAKLIGNITKIYQSYKGIDPQALLGTYYTYVVEFNSVTDGYEKLLAVLTNSQGRTHNSRSSWAGLIQEDTIARAYFRQRIDAPSDLSAIIHVYDPSAGHWYTNYIYMPISTNADKLLINHRVLQNGKYFSYSGYDDSLYYCEYEGAYNLEATLAQLGTIDKICFYTGNTGQTKPFIQTFNYSNDEMLISAVAQFSSFNQTVLDNYKTETMPENPYFTNGYQAYDMDYENDSLIFAELDVFLNGEGTATEVQVRKITDVTGFETEEYATTYVMDLGFLQ